MLFGLFRKKGGGEPSGEEGRLIHGVDTSMKYCPCCGEEYRPDFKVCGICNMALVDGWQRLAEVERGRSRKKRQDRGGLEMPMDADLVAVQKGGIREMKHLKRRLEQEGLPAMITGEQQSGCSRSCCGPEMQLLVDRADLEDVKEVLAQDYIETTGLDAHCERGLGLDAAAGRTVCPACGCAFSPTLGGCPDCGLQFD